MIPAGWELPPELRARLGASGGRQRAIVEDGHLLLILHRVPGEAGLQRQRAFFWREPTGEWHATEGKGGIGGLRQLVDSYLNTVEGLEAQFDVAHDASAIFAVLERAVPLARASANLHAALAAARESLRGTKPDAVELITLRDLAGDAERGAELLSSAARNALDYQMALQNEEQSRLAQDSALASNRLALVAAFFLPLTALSGAFGMNLPTGLDASPPLFWGIFGGGLLFGVVLGVLLSRPRRR